MIGWDALVAWLRGLFAPRKPADVIPIRNIPQVFPKENVPSEGTIVPVLGTPAPQAPQPQLQFATLEGSIDYVLRNEGGYSNDSGDSGGATNWGITHWDLSRYLGRAATDQEVREMSKTTALAIYKKSYWDPLNLCLLTDQRIATCILDIGVNRGISIGAKYAQLSLNNCGAYVEVDGKIGPATAKALNKINRAAWIENFHDLAYEGYNSIVEKNPSQAKFLRGWLKRADRLLGLI